MSDTFTNFLSNKGFGPTLRDYQHASKLYIGGGGDSYARSPKVGFLYFVNLKLNPEAFSSNFSDIWNLDDFKDVGLLAKKIDLPKFTVDNEVINQYNRKTVVQKSIKYTPISITLHDDNKDIAHNLWVNYYQNYYKDGNHSPGRWKDTKFGINDWTYGRYNNQLLTNFFDSIDIYVLHQQKFTKYTLINPKITEWAHDSLDQSAGNKIMENKFTVAYETVQYDYGFISASEPEGWKARYYDREPSPNSVAGNGANDILYAAAKESAFDKQTSKGRVYGNFRPKPPGMLEQLGTILLKNYVNENGLTRQKSVAYNIAGSVLKQTLSTGAGKYAEPPSTESAPGVFNLPGGIGINVFKGLNTTVDGKIRANPAAILFPPKP